MNRRRLLPSYHYEDAGVLPEGYTQIAYIESTGTQYINTGYAMNSNTTEIIADMENVSMPDDRKDYFFFGAKTADAAKGNTWCELYRNDANGGMDWYTRFNSAVSVSIPQYIPLEYKRYKISLSSGSLKVDGVEILEPVDTGTYQTTPITIFCKISNNGVPVVSNMKCYSFQIKEGSNIVRNLIPCLKGSVAGMYDTVNGVFYGNAGTGSFTTGGVVPNLPKSAGKDLRDYKIYGNSTQDGTPTPDYPVEIESVGDRTANLSPFSEYINTSAGFYVNSPELYDLIKNKLEVGTYTSSGNYKYKSDRESGSAANIRILSGSSGIATLLSSNSTGEYATRTIEITQEIKNQMTAVYIYFGIGSATDSYIKNFQIEKGSSATSYEPYGYRIPVEVKGKNLFDKDHADIFGGYLTLNSPVKPFTSESAVSVVLRINPNTTYTVSKLADTKFMIATFTEYPTSSTVATVWDTTHNTASSLTITSGASDIYMMIFYFDGSVTNTEEVLRNSIQVEKGSSATSYEPYFNQTTNIYLDEPLRKIGDYADYIDFRNQKVVRNIISKPLSQGNFYLASGNTSRTVFMSNNYKTTTLGILTPPTLVGTPLFLSEKFIAKSNNSTWAKGDISYNHTYELACIVGPSVTLEQFNSIIENTNLYAVLITPTEQSITLPAIATGKYSQYASVLTSLPPSKTDIQYYKSGKLQRSGETRFLVAGGGALITKDNLIFNIKES